MIESAGGDVDARGAGGDVDAARAQRAGADAGPVGSGGGNARMRDARGGAGVVVRDARGGADIAVVRHLFEAYAASLDVDLCFQNFAQELAGLPGDYAPPRGMLLIGEQAGEAIGCVGLRPLHDPGQPPRVGEVKRLYVVPRARGGRLGRALMHALLERAPSLGYGELKLDTLASMTNARALYASLGFRECAPYYHNPLPGTLYMARALPRTPAPGTA